MVLRWSAREGEAVASDGVLPGSAGNLKCRAQVADREGRAQARWCW